ncbi:MAG TPA: LLM class flavin-dependent oxidoreductase [Candidatus Limnocylindrales bacterium]|nr:LLM class flavin-dependent oxidoreductase [Candidatus Limnocylindrales bacterium]
MKIGLTLPQAAGDGEGGTWSQILALARQAEAGGADSLWVSDHFFYRAPDAAPGQEDGGHEGWTLLAALAATTTRVELGPLVLATSFRPAAILAKMAATLDDVAAGRFILGLGCGWHEPEYEAFGYPFDHRVGRFEEVLRIVRPLLRGERVTAGGRWQEVRDAALVPAPTHRIPILVAAKGERMLRLTAELADAWQTAWFGLPDERYRTRHDALLAACAEVGRDPATLEVTVGVDVQTEPGDGPSLRLDRTALVEAFAAWRAGGVDHLQVNVGPATRASFDVVLEAIAAAR